MGTNWYKFFEICDCRCSNSTLSSDSLIWTHNFLLRGYHVLPLVSDFVLSMDHEMAGSCTALLYHLKSEIVIATMENMFATMEDSHKVGAQPPDLSLQTLTSNLNLQTSASRPQASRSQPQTSASRSQPPKLSFQISAYRH